MIKTLTFRDRSIYYKRVRKRDTEMTTPLSNEVYFISVEDLAEAFENGTWTKCRQEYYIRTIENPQSVQDKKVALLNFVNHDKDEATIKVLEPLVINCRSENVCEIISGNTRVQAILELYKDWLEQGGILNFKLDEDGIETTITIFEQIPYRVFVSPISITEAIDFQTSTNDFTQKHSPYDIALKIAELRPILTEENKHKYKGNALKGAVTDILCRQFKRSKQNISQYDSVINKGTELLNQYVKDGKIIVDTASVFVGELKKLDITKNNEIAADFHLTALWNQALLDSQATGSDAAIYKTKMLQYFANLEAAKKSTDAPPAPTTETTEDTASEETPENTIKIEDLAAAFKAISEVSGKIKPETFTNESLVNNLAQIRKYDTARLELVLEVYNLINSEDGYASISKALDAVIEPVIKFSEGILDEAKNSNDPKRFKAIKRVLERVNGTAETMVKLGEPKPEKAATSATSAEVIEVSAENLTQQTVDFETENHLLSVI